MRIAIMQPYFLPYIGYFQLISAVDHFVVYDTVQFTKKGWINRNRMLKNGGATTFSVPLKKDSDFLDVSQRCISADFKREKLCNQIAGAYRGAPEFSTVMPLIERIVHFDSDNLFDFVRNSITECCVHLDIQTSVQSSSHVEGGRSDLRGSERVIDICKRMNARTYINPPGGRDLYSRQNFDAQDLELKFIQPRLPSYLQFGDEFVPSLSILDVMMFNDRRVISDTLLRDYDLAD